MSEQITPAKGDRFLGRGEEWQVESSANEGRTLVVSAIDPSTGLPGSRGMMVSTDSFLANYKPKPKADAAVPAQPVTSPIIVKGSVVVLKSGSPPMTVTGLRLNDFPKNSDRKIDEVFVAYIPEYGTEGKVVRDSFPPECLRIVPINDTPDPPAGDTDGRTP